MPESNSHEQKEVGVPPSEVSSDASWDQVVEKLPGSDHAEIDAQVRKLAQGIMDAIDKRDHPTQVEHEKYVESGEDANPSRVPTKTLEQLALERREQYLQGNGITADQHRQNLRDGTSKPEFLDEGEVKQHGIVYKAEGTFDEASYKAALVESYKTGGKVDRNNFYKKTGTE